MTDGSPSSVVDAKEIERRVNDAIRKDLHAGELDITVTEEFGAEGNEGGDEADEDIEGHEGRDREVEDDGGQDREVEDDEGQDQEAKDDEGQDQEAKDDEGQDREVEDDEGQDRAEDDEGQDRVVNLPKVPIWYQNAVTKKLWEEASPSQKNAVEKYKENDRKTSSLVDDNMGEDDRQKVTRLEEVVLFVTSHIWHSNFETHLSQHNGNIVAVAQVSNGSSFECLIEFSIKRA
jgi:hypothetical protein